jgi:hypothetical protein
MIELTPSANQRLDEYLGHLRSALRGTSKVEIGDVEQSIREHIEVALAGEHGPVGSEELAAVLDQLGSPARWIPEHERPVWHQVLARLRSGPEDWRLAYAAFGLFVLSLILVPVGIGVMVAAFFASRAAVEFIGSNGESLSARRWLILPAIAVPLVILTGLVVVGPAGPAVAWGVGDHQFESMVGQHAFDRAGSQFHGRFDAGATAAVFGVWWILAAGALALLLPILRFVFAPILDRVARRHVAGLAIVGAVAAAIGAALLWPFIS